MPFDFAVRFRRMNRGEFEDLETHIQKAGEGRPQAKYPKDGLIGSYAPVYDVIKKQEVFLKEEAELKELESSSKDEEKIMKKKLEVLSDAAEELHSTVKLISGFSGFFDNIANKKITEYSVTHFKRLFNHLSHTKSSFLKYFNQMDTSEGSLLKKLSDKWQREEKKPSSRFSVLSPAEKITWVRGYFNEVASNLDFISNVLSSPKIGNKFILSTENKENTMHTLEYLEKMCSTLRRGDYEEYKKKFKVEKIMPRPRTRRQLKVMLRNERDFKRRIEEPVRKIPKLITYMQNLNKKSKSSYTLHFAITDALCGYAILKRNVPLEIYTEYIKSAFETKEFWKMRETFRLTEKNLKEYYAYLWFSSEEFPREKIVDNKGNANFEKVQHYIKVVDSMNTKELIEKINSLSRQVQLKRSVYDR